MLNNTGLAFRATDAGTIRSRREAFLRLREADHEVYLWSSSGGAYAATAADFLGVADLGGGLLRQAERA